MSSLDQPSKLGKTNGPTGASKSHEISDNQITELTKVDGEAQNCNVNGTAGSAGDPFDPERLRLKQDFENKIGVKKALLTVPVRKPDRQWFVRVHPAAEWRLDTAVLEVKEERETYLVEPTLWPELPGEVVPKMLFTTVNRQGVVFFWPVRLQSADGKWDGWNRSAMDAAQFAMKNWVRIVPNLSLGGYEVYQATAGLPEPEWPEVSFEQLLKIAFKDRFIHDLDHPVVRRLRGAI